MLPQHQRIRTLARVARQAVGERAGHHSLVIAVAHAEHRRIALDRAAIPGALTLNAKSLVRIAAPAFLVLSIGRSLLLLLRSILLGEPGAQRVACLFAAAGATGDRAEHMQRHQV
jgi:hypothetical protein